MRLFFAISVPEGVRRTLIRVQSEIRSDVGDAGIRWALPEQLHYTLKFLGETGDTGRSMAEEAAAGTAASVQAFTLAVSGIGAFPSIARPQVVWVGAGDGAEAMAGLAMRLDAELRDRGWPAGSRPFSAHLTLARVKSPAGARSLARSLHVRQEAGGTVDKYGVFSIDRFVLMRSELCPAGAVYSVEREFSLARLAGNEHTPGSLRHVADGPARPARGD